MQQTKPFARPFAKLVLLLALVGALALAGCGGSDPAPVMPPDPPPPSPTPYETATMNIAAATTAAEAQAAYDAVKDDVTASQGNSLQMKVDARIAVLDMMERAANQRMALRMAAGMIDTSDLSTQDLVDAARMAIAGLRQALTDAVDVSEADRMMYMSMLTTAVGELDDAQDGIDTATRRMNQMTALSDASDTLQAALTALSGSTPTQAQLDAANTALGALNAAITGGADLTEDEKAPYAREAVNATAPIQTAQMAFDNAEDDEEKTRNEMMAVTAAKLYAGIYQQAADATGTAVGDVFAAYNNADQPDAGTVADTLIMVTTGDGTAANAVALSEDKMTTVADHHGWEGKRYADPAGGDEYEAIVYSNVEEPTEGDKFGQIGVGTPVDGYEYGLNANGILTTDVETTPTRVDSSAFDHLAGVKVFALQENVRYYAYDGTYHGVSGEYQCTVTGTNQCAVQIATVGFTLGGVTDADDATTFGVANAEWVFKPSNTEARVLDAVDTMYASYGWWIRKAENDGPFTASAFTDEKGAVPDAAGLNALNGTATYMGGAAGKYALSSSTGGTNDAGHFTARAMLEADFTNNTDPAAITGTLDMFMGADDQMRDWEVQLKGSMIGDTGAIGNDGSSTTSPGGTIWTIGDTAADADGNWTGALRNNGADGVPQVATGTFYSTYSVDNGATAGKMVGAFGANVQ